MAKETGACQWTNPSGTCQAGKEASPLRRAQEKRPQCVDGLLIRTSSARDRVEVCLRVEVLTERAVKQVRKVVECLSNRRNIVSLIAYVGGTDQNLVNLEPPRDAIVIGREPEGSRNLRPMRFTLRFCRGVGRRFWRKLTDERNRQLSTDMPDHVREVRRVRLAA
jgi:hypothetical protein